MRIKSAERLQVTAMSFERKYAKDKIQELGVQTYQHVFKILMFPTCQYVQGWEVEIKAWYKATVKYTNIKGGVFKVKDLKSLLLENLFYPRKDIQSDMDFAVEQNPDVSPRGMSEAQAEIRIIKFYDMLADSLYAKDSPSNLELAFNVLKS